MMVLLNPSAGGGKARGRWMRVAPRLERRFGPFSLRAPRGSAELGRAIGGALEAGERRYVAVGGDGTVNRIASVLTAKLGGTPQDAVVLGAVGIGSSNDFHKPFDAHGKLAGYPCRLDFDRPELEDVCLLEYEDELGYRRTRHWLLSASVGVTAEGAARYGRDLGRWGRALQRVSLHAALGYAAVRAVTGNRPAAWRVRVDDEGPQHLRLRNLAIVKNPHFAGVLCYDGCQEAGRGRFMVHGLEDVSRSALWKTLASLTKGRFVGGSGTWSRPARRLEIRGVGVFPLELDGEVVRARSACFSITDAGLMVAA